MIKVIKKNEMAEKPEATKTPPVKPERLPADFWVKESLQNIQATKQTEAMKFFGMVR